MRVKVTSEFYDKVLKTYQKEDSVLDVPESRGLVLCKACLLYTSPLFRQPARAIWQEDHQNNQQNCW